MSKKRIDLSGQRFGKLIVTKFTRSNGHDSFYECKCDCGNTCEVRRYALIQGRQQSCGCAKTEYQLTRRDHGLSTHPLYTIWNGMKERCDIITHPAYHNYGGRGIKYSESWLEFETFYNDNIDNYNECLVKFPNDKPSIERLDVNGDYEATNCKFIPLSHQSFNKRSNKLTLSDADEIRKNYQNGDSIYEIALRFKVTQQTILQVVNYKSWKI